MISDEVREATKDGWATLYQKTGKNPGSVMLEAKEGLDTAQVIYKNVNHSLKYHHHLNINQVVTFYWVIILSPKFGYLKYIIYICIVEDR